MIAEERLNRVRNGKLEYERMCLRVEELEALCQRITPVLSETPKALGNDKYTDDAWAALADARIECEVYIRKYLYDYAQLQEELECIHSTTIRTAMEYRYLHCLKQSDIATAMNYTERAVRGFLSKGRRIYYDRWDENEEEVSGEG